MDTILDVVSYSNKRKEDPLVNLNPLVIRTFHKTVNASSPAEGQ